jgi:hypothetical protein
MKSMLKLTDIVLAAAPATAGFVLSNVDKVVATSAGVFGLVYLGLGIALRIRDLRARRDEE